jgi:hypothetical protein
MGGQGPSFSSPKAAKNANENYTDRYGFQNKVNSRLPSAMNDIEDIRGRMGPFKGQWKNGDMIDAYGQPFNPNNPMTRQQLDASWRRYHQDEDALTRAVVPGRDIEKYRTPQEIREDSRVFDEGYKERLGQNIRRGLGPDMYSHPTTKNPRDRWNQTPERERKEISRNLPDARVGGYKTDFGGYRAGGLVRKNSNKSFKNK